MSRYRVQKELGRGGFGIVEEVIDTRGVAFARKTFAPASYIDESLYPKLRKRFVREVSTQREIGGTEIMPVVECQLTGDAPSFIMPLAEKTYDSQIAEDKASGHVNIDAIADILNGLERLHTLGYVHRDLNPKNILLHEGKWKLSDLGAVLPPSGNTVTLTDGTTIYTEDYCAPEQRNDFHYAQSSADIYSFGCILHDIFGKLPRTPYQRHSADGPIGIIIEKCTEASPNRRPTIGVLRDMVLETLVELGGQCTVSDGLESEWLSRLEEVENWTPEDHQEFARFFARIDVSERSPGHEYAWVSSVSTPFLTLLPSTALKVFAKQRDGESQAIIQKYCEWAKSTEFAFHFADTVSARLAAIYDDGDPAAKAMAIVAMLKIGYTHNRWYVMRSMLQRCGTDLLDPNISRRIKIEIRTEDLKEEFKSCVESVGWHRSELASDLQSFCRD